MKEIYDQIKNDVEIIQIYKQIHNFEDKNNGWAYHDFNHVINVANLVEKILQMLNYTDDIIYSAKIASLLHDTGALEGKDNHAFRSFIFAKNYFRKNNLEFKNKGQVLEAIKIHSDGFDTNNIIALTLILADKLDVKYTRVAEAGKNIIGNRQFLNIEDIIIYMDNNTLIFNFKTNSKINLTELNNYYFTKKIFKSIESFCNRIGKDYKIKMNNKVWKL